MAGRRVRDERVTGGWRHRELHIGIGFGRGGKQSAMDTTRGYVPKRRATSSAAGRGDSFGRHRDGAESRGNCQRGRHGGRERPRRRVRRPILTKTVSQNLRRRSRNRTGRKSASFDASNLEKLRSKRCDEKWSCDQTCKKPMKSQFRPARKSADSRSSVFSVVSAAAMPAPSGHGQRNKKHNHGKHASKNTRAKHKVAGEDGVGHRRTIKVRRPRELALAAAAAESIPPRFNLRASVLGTHTSLHLPWLVRNS